MTAKQPASVVAAPPAAATARPGAPRRRLIILVSVALALLAGLALAIVTAVSGPAAPTAHGTARPLTGTGTGTMTLNLLTGQATADFTGRLSPLGYADTISSVVVSSAGSIQTSRVTAAAHGQIRY
jgi:hypothetical protein